MRPVPFPPSVKRGNYLCEPYTLAEAIEVHYNPELCEYRIRPRATFLTYLRADAGLPYDHGAIRERQEAIECFETDKDAALGTARAMFVEFDAKPVLWRDA